MGWRSKCADSGRIKVETVRELFAEFLGTYILVVFGDGSAAQATLGPLNGTAAFASKLGVAWGYGIGLTMGVFIAGGVSGGHLNPAISLAMVILGRLKWWKFITYALAQYVGAFAAAASAYGVYNDALKGAQNATNATIYGIFSSMPGASNISTWTAFGDVILGTALLALCIMAILDENNMGCPKGLRPFMIGLVLFGIGVSFGFNASFAVNPARDLGTRCFIAIVWGLPVFSFRGFNWFWAAPAGSHIGAIIGALLYVLLVKMHHPRASVDRPPLHHYGIDNDVMVENLAEPVIISSPPPPYNVPQRRFRTYDRTIRSRAITQPDPVVWTTKPNDIYGNGDNVFNLDRPHGPLVIYDRPIQVLDGTKV